MSTETQVPTSETQQLPILKQYHKALESFVNQKKALEVQFHQLEGAIFACEHMIKQYEQSLLEGAEKFMKDAIGDKLENQGAIDNAQADEQAKEQTA